ncbi:hypothetical protein [Pasteurella sp. PK-2025]|uniref:hypothetical protein n=1 Tax=unclassified Pasteurella TaxID=2621516 RepID=UPI003C75B36B
MKKYILVGTLACTLLGCAKPSQQPMIKPEQVSGIWECVLDYPNLNSRFIDLFNFKPNGEMRNSGLFLHTIDVPMYRYMILKQGQWQVKGNQLILFANQKHVKKVHDEIAQKLIKKHKNAKSLDDQMYEILSAPIEQGERVYFNIDEMTEKTMTLSYQLSEQQYYQGNCVRSTLKKKK